MALRMPVFAPSVLTLQTVTEQCLQLHAKGTTMPRRRVHTPVELQPFERGRIVGLREAGWSYRRIAAHVGHNVGYRWCVAAFSSTLWKIPTPIETRSTDASQGGLIVGAAVVVQTASREEIRALVAPAVSPRIIGNSLIAADSQITCASGQAITHHETPSTATLVSWKSLMESGIALCCLQWRE